MAQLLVAHKFETAHKNPTKLHTTFFQHVFNHFVNFQSKLTTNVEMTVALKLGVRKTNCEIPAILDVHGMYSAWYTAGIKKCQVYLWCQSVIIIT